MSAAAATNQRGVIRIQLLGPVRAWRDEHEIDLGGPQRRAVLALLATAGGHPVSRAELIDAVWGDSPPRSATNVIQTHLKHLRQALEPDRRPRAPSTVIPSVGNGYALQGSAIDIDLLRFRRLVTEARDTHRDGDPHRTAALLDEALGLWRGTPYTDLPMLESHPDTVAIAAERWAAAARHGEALLTTGAAPDAVTILEQAAGAQPLDEAAQARLIRAYQAAGRRGQAFATHHATRRRLAEELGVDPGPELTATHTALLAEDQTPPASAAPAPAAPIIAPAQLPPVIGTFTGRADQLRQLDKLLSGAPQASTVTISAIAGTAGIGKTTLAIRWAHQVADRFPDGQLFANLRGFDPTGTVMSTADAIRGFLDTLRVPQQRIPATPEAQIGMYRSLMSGRRMLILLDNASDSAQVRPLLPGSPGCLMLVTSRHQLTGLVAADGAHPLTLDLLSEAEARELLSRRLGAERLAAEPGAVDEIIDRCAGLPLALAIVAAHAATRPAFHLAAIARELQQGLDGFASGDPATDVRAVLSWSYQALPPEPARLFRLLALHPGPDISGPAAASLAGVPVRQVRPLLAELTRAHLLTEHVPGRYTFHDLLRAHARELASTMDSEAERRAAQQRMLDHYLHAAHAASMLLDPQRNPVSLVPPAAGVVAETLGDHWTALAWFDTEHAVLVNAVGLAVRLGLDAYTWRLVSTMSTFLQWRGLWHDWLNTQLAALHAARRLREPAREALAHGAIGRAYVYLGRYDEARSYLQRALPLLGEVSDQAGQAHTYLALGRLEESHGRYREALECARQALELLQAAGNATWQARALSVIGWYLAKLGDHHEAIRSCQQALAGQEATDDRHGRGMTLDSLGYAHHELGAHAQAMSCYQRALELHRETGDRYNEAETLAHLGDTHHALGKREDARTAWQYALAILDELAHLDADQVRDKLRRLAGSP